MPLRRTWEKRPGAQSTSATRCSGHRSLNEFFPVSSQVLNVNSFGRWFFRDRDQAYEETDFCKNLRALAAGCVNESAARAPRKYSHSTYPKYGDVLSAVLRFVTSTKTAADSLTQGLQKSWDYQAAVVLASQFLLPPMRGKPFWALSLEDAPGASMSLCMVFPSVRKTQIIWHSKTAGPPSR